MSDAPSSTNQARIAASIRSLKIAVTVVSLASCVLLIAFWLGIRVASPFHLPPSDGQQDWEVHLGLGSSQISVIALLPLEWSDFLINMRTVDVFGFNLQGSRRELFVAIPYWFLVALSAALAMSPWIHWSRRFGLRTLLIATTLIAVVLGLVVASI